MNQPTPGHTSSHCIISVVWLVSEIHKVATDVHSWEFKTINVYTVLFGKRAGTQLFSRITSEDITVADCFEDKKWIYLAQVHD